MIRYDVYAAVAAIRWPNTFGNALAPVSVMRVSSRWSLLP